MSDKNDKVLRDINLYSLDQLVEELFNRCEDCVIVTSRFEDKGDPTVRATSKRGAVSALGLLRIGEEIYVDQVFGEDDDS